MDALNRIVTAYLEFAELQARGRKSMHMSDWIAKLDDFLRLSDRDVLRHAGTMSHEAAQVKAENEFAAFRTIVAAQPQPVDTDFDAAIKKVNALPAAKRKKGGPTR